MRQIKFRAWDIFYKKFIYSDGLMSDFWLKVEGGLAARREVPVQESTGIEDLSGKEILTNGGGTKFLVRHSHGSCGFVCIRQPQQFDMGNPHGLQHRRIIGNNYENPELIISLKEKVPQPKRDTLHS